MLGSHLQVISDDTQVMEDCIKVIHNRPWGMSERVRMISRQARTQVMLDCDLVIWGRPSVKREGMLDSSEVKSDHAETMSDCSSEMLGSTKATTHSCNVVTLDCKWMTSGRVEAMLRDTEEMTSGKEAKLDSTGEMLGGGCVISGRAKMMRIRSDAVGIVA